MQSYRFLRAVMNTAVRDGAIAKNPCQIPGAGSDRAKERPVATPARGGRADWSRLPRRYRAAVCWPHGAACAAVKCLACCLADVDLAAKTVTVRRNRVELLENSRAAFDAQPKTDAGKRTVMFPPHVLAVLERT